MPPSVPPPDPTLRDRLTGLLILAVPFLLGADDGYLREIEAEVKRQAATLVTGQAQSEPAPAAAADRLAPGLDVAAFEGAMREALPGTYTLYQQLDPDRRREVYDAYQNDNRLASISEQIARRVGGKP